MNSMYSPNKSLADEITVLRFPLIVLVVFIHSVPQPIQTISFSFETANLYALLTESLSHGIGRIAVPAFFLFSGYMFFLNVGPFLKKHYYAKIKSRLHTILLPYIFWISFYISIILIKNFVFTFNGRAEDDFYYLLQTHSIIELFWIQPILYPLWYLRDLMIMIIMTPLFYYLIRKFNLYFILSIALLYYSNVETYVPGLSTTAIFFFGLGSYFGIGKKNPLPYLMSYRYPIYFAYLILLIFALALAGSYYYEYIMRLSILFGIMILFIFSQKILALNRLKKIFTELAPTVFFIYVVHTIYIINVFLGLLQRLNYTLNIEYNFIGYLLLPFLVVFSCVGVYFVINKWNPNVLGIMVGKRT